MWANSGKEQNMRRHYVLASGMACGSLLVLLLLSTPAQQFKPQQKELTLVQRVAEASRLSEENADRVLQALGPAIREELAKGKEVSLPGLGRFRVVRVQEHRDLVDGRPALIPAANHVEFVASDALDGVANAAGAKPADTVVPFHYIPVPGQTPSQKVPSLRIAPTRVK
jgi:nucleoid DNA-binding protein